MEKTGWMLSFMSLLPISILIYQDPTSFMAYLLLFVVAALMISLYIDKRKDKRPQFLSLLLCIGVGLISVSGNFLLGVLYVIAGISERFYPRTLKLDFQNS